MKTLLVTLMFGLALNCFGQTPVEVNSPQNFNRKVRIVSTQWDDHLEISRSGWGGIFKPDQSGGYRGLRLDLIGDNSNFYVLNGNVGIGTTAPTFNLEILDDGYGDQIKFQRGTGVAKILQDNNLNNLYIEAASGLHLNSISGGRVGIGTNAPQGLVHLKSTWPSLIIEKAASDAEAVLLFQKAGAPQFYIWSDNQGAEAVKFMAGGLTGEHDGLPRMEFPIANKNIYMAASGGNVGIGTTDPKGYKLAVAGKTVTEEVVVKLQANWPDYVFDSEYKLLSLSEVEQYIKANKHLPEVPSALQIRENGLSVGEMNTLLLKKVEELTLHLIELKKENDSLKYRVEIIENKR